MEKAYDVQVLMMNLKGRGLDVAEEAAKVIVEELMDWLAASAKLSATPFDDVAATLLPMIKEAALKEVDKIDGQVG